MLVLVLLSCASVNVTCTGCTYVHHVNVICTGCMYVHRANVFISIVSNLICFLCTLESGKGPRSPLALIIEVCSHLLFTMSLQY